MQDVQRIVDFREGTRRLALEGGYPVLTSAGTFIPDARAAWLLEAVEDWHVRSQVPRADPGWFHASSLGKADEELVAEYLGEIHEPHDAKRLRVFDLGHNRDAAWKEYLRAAGLTIAQTGHRAMKLEWLRLSGECDEIVVDPEGKLCLVELKTKAQHLFAKLSEPDAAHRLQVNAYMGGMGIHQAIVLYEAKNDQAVKVFYVPFDGDVWDSTVARLQRLRREAEGELSSAQVESEPVERVATTRSNKWQQRS